MKIEGKANPFTELRNIQYGEVFEMNGTAYIMVDCRAVFTTMPYLDEETDAIEMIHLTCVRLIDGELELLEHDRKVIHIPNAKLVY